ncbi:MAG: SIR2 family NAD-dependent protein deacylase [Schwartzia sp. (in: firmicutes)]
MKEKNTQGNDVTEAEILRLREVLASAEAVMIGAGAGLSTSAGYAYSGTRFSTYFEDFARRCGFSDMYAGGFYPYATREEFWAYWSRNVYLNRYTDPPRPVYDHLYRIVKDKDYFVLTTNVDHCFQKAGFDKRRLFYTQGDYGLFQCSEPCHEATYDNEDTIRRMVLAQGYTIQGGTLCPPKDAPPKMTVPSALLPDCPRCDKPMAMNLRIDDTFVEDEGCHRHAAIYAEYLHRHCAQRTVFLELGVGENTPGIIKLPFWQMTKEWPNAAYVCLNYGEAYAPPEIRDKALCLSGDIGDLLARL